MEEPASNQRRSGRATKKPFYADSPGSSVDSASIRHVPSKKKVRRSQFGPGIIPPPQIKLVPAVAVVSPRSPPATTPSGDDDVLIVSPPKKAKVPLNKYAVGLTTEVDGKSGKKVLKPIVNKLPGNSGTKASSSSSAAVNGHADSDKSETSAQSPATVNDTEPTTKKLRSSGVPAADFFASSTPLQTASIKKSALLQCAKRGRAARDATLRKISALNADERHGDDEQESSPERHVANRKSDDDEYRESQDDDDDDDDDADDDSTDERIQSAKRSSNRSSNRSGRGRVAEIRPVAARSSGRRAAAAATEAMTTSSSNGNSRSRKRRGSSSATSTIDDDSEPVVVRKKRRRGYEASEDDDAVISDDDYAGDEPNWGGKKRRHVSRKAPNRSTKSKPAAGGGARKKVKGLFKGKFTSRKPKRGEGAGSDFDDDNSSRENDRVQRKFDLDYKNNPFKQAAKMKVVTPLEQRLDDMLNTLSAQIGFKSGETVFNGGDADQSSLSARRGGPKSRDKRHSQNAAGGEDEEQDELSANSSADWAPVLYEQSPPFVKNGTMRDYQVRGLNFMMECLHHSLNPILADEMGLGKTLQTISLFAHYVEIKKVRKPMLVVAPKSTLHNWMAEIAKWCPSLHALCLIGEKHERPEVLKAWFRANDPAGLKRHRFPSLKKPAQKLGQASSSEGEEAEDDENIAEDAVQIENDDADDEKSPSSAAPPPPMKAADIIAAARLNKDNKPYHILVTSYEMCLYEKCFLRKQPWSILVIDEAHRIKNEHSKLSETVRLFAAEHRVLLTGTPLQNNLRELWALLNFLKPELFVSAEEFEEYFNLSGEKQDFLIKKLHAILRPFMLRRLKSEVEKGLPPKKEVRVYVPMSDLQRRMYKQMLVDKRTMWHPKADAGANKISRKVFNNIVMQLRKICNHPYLFDDVDPSPPGVDPADDNLQHVVDACGKLEFIDKLLTRLKKDGHRVLLFSQMTRMLDILDDYCRWRKYEYCRIDGNTDHVSRQEQIEEFNAPNSTKFLFLLSTRAGGLGINLATADVVIIYDSDWNPQVDFQAIDRAHRIGQTKPVRVFRFVTDGTIEEGVIKRAEMKRRLDNVVIQQGRIAQAQAAAASKEELREILRASAASTLAEDAKVDVKDIDAVLAKSEARTAELDKKLDQMGESQLQKFSLDVDDSRLNAYQFEGKNFKVDDKIKRQLWAGYGESFIQQQNLVDMADVGAAGGRRRRAAVYASQHTGEMTELDYAYMAYVQSQQQAGETPIPKLVHRDISSWHFPPARLLELREKEMNYFKHIIGYEPKANDEDFEDEDEEFDENTIDVDDDDDDEDEDEDDENEAGGGDKNENENNGSGQNDAEKELDTLAVGESEEPVLPKKDKKQFKSSYTRKKQAQNRKRSKFETALRKIRSAQPLTLEEQTEKRNLEQLQDAKGYHALDSKFLAQFKDALFAVNWHHKHDDRKPDDIVKQMMQLRPPQRYDYVLRQKRDLLRRYFIDFAALGHSLPGWASFKLKLDRSSTKRTQGEQSTRALVWYVNSKCGGPVKMGRSLQLVQAKALFLMDSPLPSSSSAAAMGAGLNPTAINNMPSSKGKVELCSDAEDQLILYYAYTSGKSPHDQNLPNLILQLANHDDSFMSFNNNILRKLTIEDIRERLRKLVKKLCEEYVRQNQPEVNVVQERVTQAKLRTRFRHVWRVADKLPVDDLERLLRCTVKAANKTLSDEIMQSNAVRHITSGAAYDMLPQSPPFFPAKVEEHEEKTEEISARTADAVDENVADKPVAAVDDPDSVTSAPIAKSGFLLLTPPPNSKQPASAASRAQDINSFQKSFGLIPPPALIELWQAQGLPIE